VIVLIKPRSCTLFGCKRGAKLIGVHDSIIKENCFLKKKNVFKKRISLFKNKYTVKKEDCFKKRRLLVLLLQKDDSMSLFHDKCF
jgi:hypothetical protein